MDLWQARQNEIRFTGMTHDLKIKPEYFEQVQLGFKTFEVRKNDRNFQVGDKLLLKEWSGGYTGRKIECLVTYITNFKQKRNYVVLNIGKVV